MILSADIRIRIKKEHFANLIYEFYSRSCDIHRLELVDTEDGEDIYLIETVYTSRHNYNNLIDILKKNSDKYTVISQKNSIEEKIRGGLLQIKSRNPVENTNDYNMNILGATELIKDKIASGEWEQYSSVSKNAAVISGINSSEELSNADILNIYSETEKEALTISRFAGLNAIPLIIEYSNTDDIIKTINRIESGFSIIKISRTAADDLLIADRIAAGISKPFISREFDEIPLYLISAAIMIIKKYELNPADTTVGFIGLNSTTLRCSSLFDKTGFFKVLGNDNSDKNMMEFEKFGGMATTPDNILLNSDILFLKTDSLEDIDLGRIRPGQFVILFGENKNVDLKTIKQRGAREIILIDNNSVNSIHPGITSGVLKSVPKRLNDQVLIHTAKKLSLLMGKEFTMPDIFTDIHEKLASIICETN